MTTLPDVPDAPATIPALIRRNARDHPGLPALSWPSREGTGWSTLTWERARAEIAALAAGLASLGVSRDDTVLLLMSNRPEHWLTDLALVHLGAVPITLYDTSAPEQLAHMARHSRAKLAIVENAAAAARMAPLLTAGLALERLVVVEEAEAGEHTPWSGLGTAAPAPDFEALTDRVRPEDRLTVIYTSGTTGPPKGVVVSHRTVLNNAVALDEVVEMPEHVEHIGYLPLAHIAERMLGIYLPVFRASHVYLCPDYQAVGAVAREVRPREFFGAPRVWEKLAAAVRARLATLPDAQREAIAAAGEVARAHIACREDGRRLPDELEARFRAVQKQILTPLLAAGGLDRVVWAASASAPMPLDVVRFWADLGLVVMDGWGLTETVGVATCNSPRSGFRLGSVGRPISSVEIRAAEDGEILVRGTSLFDGYLQPDGSVRPATDAAGWLPTGDIGRIDEDGFLWITDRKKEMIITSTGKNISPALVESALKEHPLIGQAFVHGEGRSYLVALLVIDPETAPGWVGTADTDPAALAAHPRVLAEVRRAVEAANARLNRTEQVKRYRVLGREWAPETGELTPSLKLRRAVIRERYATELDALYAESEPRPAP